ncbi:MAG: sigma-70 family RNA polymerase sigma factor [Pirellulales bacterium]
MPRSDKCLESDRRGLPCGLISEIDFASALLRRCIQKSHQLSRQSEFARSDFDDLIQELFVRVWPKLRRYDAARAKLSTFVSRIVEHEAASFVRERRAAKRDFLLDGPSIDAPLVDPKNGVTTLANLIVDDVHQRRLGHPPDYELLADAADRVLDNCSADEARILRAMMHKPTAEAARSLGVSRQQIYRTIARVRKRYEGADLQQFLDAQPDT